MEAELNVEYTFFISKGEEVHATLDLYGLNPCQTEVLHETLNRLTFSPIASHSP